MDHDDVLTMLNAVQNPALEAIRRADELTGRGALQRIAREAQQLQHVAPSLADLHLPSLASAEREALAASRALLAGGGPPAEWMQRFSGVESLASYRAWGVPSVTEQMFAETLFQTRGAFADAQAQIERLVDADRVIRDMTKHFGEPLSGYARFLRDAESQLAVTHRALLGSDAFDAIERDFEQLKRVAIALDPLQRLTGALSASLGGSLPQEELQAQLDRHYGAGLAAGWGAEFESFVALIDDTWGDELQDDDVDDTVDDDAAEVDDAGAATLDSEEREESVWGVAVRYVLPQYELTGRLTRLAGRIDPSVHGGAVSFERMILAIGCAHPAHAEALMRLTYPFLQHLAWGTAPRGPRANGTSESLALDEVEAFEALAFAIMDVLDEIEDQTREA
jgi:hypothetical protein